MTIGDRLREERERLGFSQAEFAALADKSERTQVDWEKGVSFPNAKNLEAFAEAGADVAYVVTGRAWGQSSTVKPVVLSSRERALVDSYRYASEAGRKALDAMGVALSDGSTSRAGAEREPAAKMTFHGSVGSVNDGDAVIHNYMGKSPKKAAPKG